MKIALPNKGRLAETVRAVLDDAGLGVRVDSDRALTASIGEGFVALFVRAQDIPEFVADGAAHAGITGWDCVAESGRDLEMLLDLGFGRCRLVVAIKNRDDGEAGAGAASIDAIAEGARVATTFPRLAAKFFEDRGKTVQIVPISGAAEVAPHLGIADVIVDLVSTGSTLRVNGLTEVATVVESSARLVSAPRTSLAPEVARALNELAFAISSVVNARHQRYLMANVPRHALEAVRDLLPGLRGPTVVDVLGTDFVAVHAVVPEKSVYKTTLALKAHGCEGILVTRIERLVP
ncbi:MAG: ATP phosphoribosyltransferase [Polyangiaceae bacterium]|nr:ATP phosphoribosyltransferase [Polyangiaceae bacterium]